MSGQQFPVAAVFHLEGVDLPSKLRVFTANIDQGKVAEPEIPCGVNGRPDEFLEGGGNLYYELLGRIPRALKPGGRGEEQEDKADKKDRYPCFA